MSSNANLFAHTAAEGSGAQMCTAQYAQTICQCGQKRAHAYVKLAGENHLEESEM